MADSGSTPVKLLVVIASTRPVRVGEAVATWFADAAKAHGAGDFEVTVADLRAIDLPLMNEPNHPRQRNYVHDHTKAWSALVDASDAFVFVFPEYNFSMTAPLKNALDYLVFEWQYKPVGLVSYGGMSAGLRAAMQVRQVVTPFKLVPMSEAVALPMVSNNINDDGEFDPNESATRSAEAMLTELKRWAIALKPLRTGEI